MSTNSFPLPPNLPKPTDDDGAAAHLSGMQLPDVTLPSTDGASINLRALKGRWVIYIYPMTGRPGVPLPDGWDGIPGARGCTPQSCSFRDHYTELQELGAGVLGLSTQSSDYQQEARDRLHLPFQLLSDSGLELKDALRLPTFTAAGMELYKRLTLIAENGMITKVFYPVFPPDRNADEVLAWLRASSEAGEAGQLAPLPVVSRGVIERITNFRSQYVTPRHIDIWLPDGYRSDGKYAVLYMHDGQMLFDAAITWNQQTWAVADVMSKLTDAGVIRDCIIVGIWNAGSSRHADYFPQRPFEQLPANYRQFLLQQAKRADGTALFVGEIQSDNYLRFITRELKPLVDRTYATLPNAENTFIAGSSMGGLISLYAVCEYPDLFGGAACLSTHWVGVMTDAPTPIPDAFVDYLRQHLPDPAHHRIYFDHGTETLDALYEPHQVKVDQVMKSRGYSAASWQTRKFAGADHSENAWRQRLHLPLSFLLHV